MSTSEPPKIFVSYTHDSAGHNKRVLDLSDQLRTAGFDSDLDQYHVNERWPTWMEQKISSADYVIVVCTESYSRRWNNQEQPGTGLGAQWESLLTRQWLYESPAVNNKFVPVVFERSDLGHIPTPLRDVTRFVLPGDFDLLVRRLLDLPPAQMPPVRTSLAPIALAPGFFALSGASAQQVGIRDEEETLLSNLFSVETPCKINTAEVVRKKRPKKFTAQIAGAWKAVEGAGRVPMGYWIEEGILYTFEDIATPVWKYLFEQGVLKTRSPKPTADWSLSKSFADKNRFIKLLNRSFEQYCARSETFFTLGYSKEMKCFLFQAMAGKREGYLKVKAIKVDASRMIYRAISDRRSDVPDAIQHWQHEAFRYRFQRFGSTWYLSVTPFWAFTIDGIGSPSRWQKTSSANMRRPEKNRAVLGHVMFWASILCREPDLLRPNERFRIHRPVELKARPAITDADWMNIAKEEDRQMLEDDLGILL